MKRERMSLEEEVAIVRFGQGVLSDTDLLERYSVRDKAEKKTQLFDLSSLVDHAKPVDADIERAIANSGLDPTDSVCVFLTMDRLRVNRMLILPEESYDHAYQLHLHLFKTAYQRRFASEKGHPTKWWFWDLSQNETVQEILTAHQTLVEEVYQNAGFWNEFASIAKLWNEHEALIKARYQEPATESETRFDFVTYDDMVTNTVRINEEEIRYSRNMAALRNSLGRALSKKYGLDSAQEMRLFQDVMERHSEQM